MPQVIADISTSLDGYVAGPDPTLEEPLGRGGEQLHEWAFAARAWREPHGREGGEEGVDSDVIEELFSSAGASIIGRRMFSGGAGPWEQDPMADGWWGDEPPFGHPLFVLTHHERQAVEKGRTTFTFVTDGIEVALDRARAAAGDLNVAVGGGAEVIRQYLSAGLLDELRLHVAPVLLGGGTPLFDGNEGRLERTRTIESPSGVVHLSYRLR
jgi:dihydrofolate reductase